VQEFIAEVELRYGKSVIRTKGRNSITWVHPLLFIDIALAISPRLKIETYQWIIDDLCGIRDNSGDSFKEMCGYLYDHYPNKYEFPKFVKEVSAKIRRACNYSSEHENWNYASKEQLKMRDDLHKAIAGFADVLRKPEEAVRIALTQHQKRLRG
ncbi:MAG: KilA-N domain-containing protein, partial [Microcystaceae cyanobacterium]